MRVGLVELRQVALLAAPVEGLVADDAHQRLRGHVALHGVPRGAAGHLTALVEQLHAALRVTKIPSQAVGAAVHVARGTRCLAQARRAMRVIQERPARLHIGRGGVVQRQAADLRASGGADDRQRSLEAIQHEQPGAIARERESGGALANGDVVHARTGAAGHDHVVRSQARNIGGAIRSHHHAARIADGRVLGHVGDGGLRVGEVRIQVDRGGRGAARRNGGHHRTDEDAVHVGRVTQFVARLHTNGNHVARSGRHRHARHDGHEALHVGGGQRVGRDHGQIVVEHVPGDQAGPVTAVAVDPAVRGILARHVRHLGRRGK